MYSYNNYWRATSLRHHRRDGHHLYSRSKSPGGTLRLTNKTQTPQTNFKKTISTWNGWIDANWKPNPPTATSRDCCFFSHFGKCNKNADGTKAKGAKDSCPVCRGGSCKDAPLTGDRYLKHSELRRFIKDNTSIGVDLKGWTKTKQQDVNNASPPLPSPPTNNSRPRDPNQK
jgi:hypothetical protein